jgi:hypothetical protein
MRALFVALVVAVVLAPAQAAAADGGLRSTLTGIDPGVDGLDIVIVDDERMQLTNGTGETTIVLGYAQEPYLKFEEGAVYANTNSGSYYLNRDRLGTKDPPADIDLSAPPEWKKVADGDTYDWHDHRIHWMEVTDPEVVRNDRGSEHHIFDWSVPMEVGSQAVEVNGRLDYVPPDDSRSILLFGGIGALVVGGFAAALFLRRKRSARPA